MLHLIPRAFPRPFHGFASEKEPITLARHPWADALLRLSIGWGNVNMIDTRFNDGLHQFIGFLLRDFIERRRAENGEGTHVACTPKPTCFHMCLLFCLMKRRAGFDQFLTRRS